MPHVILLLFMISTSEVFRADRTRQKSFLTHPKPQENQTWCCLHTPDNRAFAGIDQHREDRDKIRPDYALVFASLYVQSLKSTFAKLHKLSRPGWRWIVRVHKVGQKVQLWSCLARAHPFTSLLNTIHNYSSKLTAREEEPLLSILTVVSIYEAKPIYSNDSQNMSSSFLHCNPQLRKCRKRCIAFRSRMLRLPLQLKWEERLKLQY